MNTELCKIDKFLRDNGFSPETYQSMSEDTSGNPLVFDSASEAFNFDEIIKNMFVSRPSSMDSLLLKDSLYFIEFKNGYPNAKKKTKTKLITQSLKLKLSESLIVLHELLLQQSNASKSFRVIAIIVLNSGFFPLTATVGVLGGLSGFNSCPSTSPFYKYREASLVGTNCFYDDVQIWNECNFSSRIKMLV